MDIDEEIGASATPFVELVDVMMAALQSAGITGAECQVDALSPGGPEADHRARPPLRGDVQGKRSPELGSAAC